MSNREVKWFIARCSKVRIVQEDLGGEYPVIQQWTKPSRKKKPVLSSFPIFPHLLFFKMDRYDEVMDHPMVSGPVKYGKVVMGLTDENMDQVRAMSDHGVVDMGQDHQFSVGDTVEVVEGLLLGEAGSIKNINKHGEITLDIPHLNFPVSLHHCFLKSLVV